MRRGGIYKFTNKHNGKVYIGQSNDLDRRYKEHMNWESVEGIKSKKRLYMAFGEFGRDNFTYEVIKEIPWNDIDSLNLWEDYFIKHYGSMHPRGYNDVMAPSVKYVSANYAEEEERNQREALALEEAKRREVERVRQEEEEAKERLRKIRYDKERNLERIKAEYRVVKAEPWYIGKGWKTLLQVLTWVIIVLFTPIVIMVPPVLIVIGPFVWLMFWTAKKYEVTNEGWFAKNRDKSKRLRALIMEEYRINTDLIKYNHRVKMADIWKKPTSKVVSEFDVTPVYTKPTITIESVDTVEDETTYTDFDFEFGAPTVDTEADITKFDTFECQECGETYDGYRPRVCHNCDCEEIY